MKRAQIIALVVALLLTCAALAAIPSLQLRADHAARARGAAAGAALIHRFDCTYGRSLKDIVASTAYASSVTSGANFELAQHQHGDQRKSTLRLARAQQLRAADLLRQYGQIKPLDPRNIPCPPRSSRIFSSSP